VECRGALAIWNVNSLEPREIGQQRRDEDGSAAGLSTM
jgi:hypothetical protein